MPVITLTTDFGLADPFAGIMKGVIADICPAARVIDLSHNIPSFSIQDGALALWQSWRYFPAGTIHVAVIDPGVGSTRLPILARMGSYWFVAPDNGLLTLIERDVRRSRELVEFRHISNPDYRLTEPSSTFHGRDIFAPAAAHLARQIEQGHSAPETFGPVVDRIEQLGVPEPIHHPDGSVEGVVLKSDRFGNLLTNLITKDVRERLPGAAIYLGDRAIRQFSNFFASGASGELLAVFGSCGLLEIAVNRGSAFEQTGAQAGSAVFLRPDPSG